MSHPSPIARPSKPSNPRAFFDVDIGGERGGEGAGRERRGSGRDPRVWAGAGGPEAGGARGRGPSVLNTRSPGRVAGSGRERGGSRLSRAAAPNVLDGEGPRSCGGVLRVHTRGAGKGEKHGPAANGPPVGRETASPPGPASSAGVSPPNEQARGKQRERQHGCIGIPFPGASQLRGAPDRDAGERARTAPSAIPCDAIPEQPRPAKCSRLACCPAPYRSPGYLWPRPAPTHPLTRAASLPSSAWVRAALTLLSGRVLPPTRGAVVPGLTWLLLAWGCRGVVACARPKALADPWSQSFSWHQSFSWDRLFSWHGWCWQRSFENLGKWSKWKQQNNNMEAGVIFKSAGFQNLHG